MKVALFLGTLAMMGISVGAYGKVYPRDGIPQKDCLEMMCGYGCMEDEVGGYCCPAPESLPIFGQACTECGCKSNLNCQLAAGKSRDGTCVCPSDKPYWNGSSCVECLTDASECKKCTNYVWTYPTGSINGDACRVCDGAGNPKTLANGAGMQSDGRCCVGGSLGYNDNYCPGCKDITLGNRYEMAPYPYYCENKEEWINVDHFGWSDSRTITVVEKNMTLKADVLYVRNFNRYTVYDETTQEYLANYTDSAIETLRKTVELQVGHTYRIELEFENLCEHCSVEAKCK